MIHLFLALMFSLSAFAEDSSTREIDSELQTLFLKLHEQRKDEFNTEIQGQAYMRNDWTDYAKQLQQAEKDEHEADKIVRRIAELQARKQALLKQNPHP